MLWWTSRRRCFARHRFQQRRRALLRDSIGVALARLTTLSCKNERNLMQRNASVVHPSNIENLPSFCVGNPPRRVVAEPTLEFAAARMSLICFFCADACLPACLLVSDMDKY